MPATADAIVLFGATGDLARRMLLPSLYFLDADGFLPKDFRLVAPSRRSSVLGWRGARRSASATPIWSLTSWCAG